MTNQADDLDDEEEEYDEPFGENDYGDLIGEDEWEDSAGAKKLKAALPKGWTLVKCVNFTFRTMGEMETWLKDNCRAKYERVGFRSGCSYNVAVQFEDYVDAVMFKLRWR
jgi:hypothetical protein